MFTAYVPPSTSFFADQRAGTHATKTRGFVSGGGRSHGGRRAPAGAAGLDPRPPWRGGAIIFGPQPRSYAKKVPRKVKQNAFRSIWSDLVSENRIVVVDRFGIDKPQTRRMVVILDSWGSAAGCVGVYRS
jgi:large subunit ribosomal protein L4